MAQQNPDQGEMLSSVYRIRRPLPADTASAWRDIERASFDELYGRVARAPLQPDDDNSFRPTITPPWVEGGTQGGLVQGEVYRLLMERRAWECDVLDYGCGNGKWAVQLASKGSRVSGFDLSPVAIDYGRKRAELDRVSVRFDVADAAQLPYTDESFDFSLGIGVLHHVIKYAGTAAELHRVLRPTGLALFTETLAENPLIEVGRKFTMRGKGAAGDVGLTQKLIAEWAADGSFRRVDIIPLAMLLMVKRITRFRPLLRGLSVVDRFLLDKWPKLDRYCGDCIVVFSP